MEYNSHMGPKTYSWGELYETLDEMRRNGEEFSDPVLEQGLVLLRKLDYVTSLSELFELLFAYTGKDYKWMREDKNIPITKMHIDKLNSPCLDGLLSLRKFYPYDWRDADFHLLPIETIKFLLCRGIITTKSYKKKEKFQTHKPFYIVSEEDEYINATHFMYELLEKGSAKLLRAIFELKNEILCIPKNFNINCITGNKDAEVFNILVENGYQMTDIDIVWAAERKRADLVLCCLELGADPHCSDNSVLGWAYKNKDIATKEVLQKWLGETEYKKTVDEYIIRVTNFFRLFDNEYRIEEAWFV